jgi:glutaminase
MPDPTVAKLANAFVTHQETSAVSIAPETLLKQGAVTANGGVLTVKNQELANLIQAKLASAALLTTGRNAASDADVSVGVKVHF